MVSMDPTHKVDFLIIFQNMHCIPLNYVQKPDRSPGPSNLLRDLFRPAQKPIFGLKSAANVIIFPNWNDKCPNSCYIVMTNVMTLYGSLAYH